MYLNASILLTSSHRSVCWCSLSSNFMIHVIRETYNAFWICTIGIIQFVKELSTYLYTVIWFLVYDGHILPAKLFHNFYHGFYLMLVRWDCSGEELKTLFVTQFGTCRKEGYLEIMKKFFSKPFATSLAFMLQQTKSSTGKYNNHRRHVFIRNCYLSSCPLLTVTNFYAFKHRD